MNTLQDRIRGSLIGGAIGDALGYPVEFMYSFEEIQKHYGERGITRLDTDNVVSDDTQMTLFTANGILNAQKLGMSFIHGICKAYIEWFFTQIGRRSDKFNDCWIAELPELNENRAPGMTCMSSLRTIYNGGDPVNSSKGCGGVMRIAPIPLYAIVNDRMSITESDVLAGEAAEITHQHPLGFMSAALAAHVIYRLATDEFPQSLSLEDYISEGMEAMRCIYPQYPGDLSDLGALCEKAIALAKNDKSDVENIESIGGGWVGDEALAIALYCALKHFDNFEEAMIAAVNHAGDSDSTGAVCGNILGAAIGYDAIPQHFKDNVEMHDLIIRMADDLYRGEITKM